jgi:hypothetical protein
MEHAGFDALHSPFGAAMVCVGLLMISGIIMFGSVLVKAAMAREKAVRQSMREAQDTKR